MSKTPFDDLGSTEILSAHISGLQHAVNKIESALNMGTATAAGHPLAPVTDQVDPSLHYRIYEGSIRNWMITPAPVVKRNGVAVPDSEYTLLAAYGAVIFTSQQQPADSITVDMTYLREWSGELSDLSDAVPLLHRGATYRANNATAGALVDVILAANTIEALPFPVPYPTAYDRIAVYVTTPSAAGAKARLGIYRDTGTIYPGPLVLDAGEVTTDATGVREIVMDLPLSRGLYWLVRTQNGTPTIKGVPAQCAISLGLYTDWTGGFAVSRSGTFTYGALPQTFLPSASAPITGGDRGSVFLRHA